MPAEGMLRSHFQYLRTMTHRGVLARAGTRGLVSYLGDRRGCATLAGLVCVVTGTGVGILAGCDTKHPTAPQQESSRHSPPSTGGTPQGGGAAAPTETGRS